MFIMGSWERCIPVFIIFTPPLPQGDPMTCSPIELRGYRHREIYKDTNVEEYEDTDKVEWYIWTRVWGVRTRFKESKVHFKCERHLCCANGAAGLNWLALNHRWCKAVRKSTVRQKLESKLIMCPKVIYILAIAHQLSLFQSYTVAKEIPCWTAANVRRQAIDLVKPSWSWSI